MPNLKSWSLFSSWLVPLLERPFAGSTCQSWHTSHPVSVWWKELQEASKLLIELDAQTWSASALKAAAPPSSWHAECMDVLLSSVSVALRDPCACNSKVSAVLNTWYMEGSKEWTTHPMWPAQLWSPSFGVDWSPSHLQCQVRGTKSSKSPICFVKEFSEWHEVDYKLP